MSIFDIEQEVKQEEKKKKKAKKKLKINFKKEDFFQVPLLVAIIFALVGIASAGAGAFLYKEQKTLPFTADISNVFYKTFYEKSTEAENLREELDMTERRGEQSEQKAQEEKTKRIEVEGEREEAKQETLKEESARKQAEGKAEEEEQKRKAKEEELAEKEKEEKELAEDKDYDGLTYRQELDAGTSDYDNDTDDDGIIDGEDQHPAGGGRYQAQTFSWTYEGQEWEWTENIHEDWYEYYKNKPRTSHGITYVTSDDPFVEKIAKKLSEVNTEEGFVCKSCFVISFIQSLSYIYDFYTGHDEYPKYPVETFFEKNGDCEDTSYLAASIIDAFNIDVRLVLLPGHMAVGVAFDCSNSGTYYKSDSRCYYYIETTTEGYEVGDISDEYRYTEAELINVRTGSRSKVYPSYNSPCEKSSLYPDYYTDGTNYYKDSGCSNMTTCLPSAIYSGRYWNGYNSYWDDNCTMKVVSGCNRSSIYYGFYFDGINWYVDYQCTRRAYLE